MVLFFEFLKIFICKILRLKPGAVPSIFKNIHLYYANKDVPLRSGNALSKIMHDNESAILQKQCEIFL